MMSQRLKLMKRMENQRKSLYKSKCWKDNKQAFILSKVKEHGCVCERCGSPVYVYGISDRSLYGKIPRHIVHHKKYLDEINYLDDDIAYDWNNLELLCKPCHEKEHSHKSIRNGLYFDENGNLKQAK